jgi:hypothetical protein
MFKTFQPDGTPLIAVPSGTDDGENQWVSPQLDAICAGRADVQWKRLLTREFDFLALEPSGGCPGRIEGARNERRWTRETLRVGAQHQSDRMRKFSLAHMPSAVRKAEEGLAEQPNCESAGS